MGREKANVVCMGIELWLQPPTQEIKPHADMALLWGFLGF